MDQKAVSSVLYSVHIPTVYAGRHARLFRSSPCFRPNKNHNSPVFRPRTGPLFWLHLFTVSICRFSSARHRSDSTPPPGTNIHTCNMQVLMHMCKIHRSGLVHMRPGDSFFYSIFYSNTLNKSNFFLSVTLHLIILEILEAESSVQRLPPIAYIYSFPPPGSASIVRNPYS